MQNSKLKVKSCSLKFKVFLFAFLITTLDFTLLTFNLSELQAQTFSLSISPPLLEVMIMPGKSITQAYQLTNSGELTVINTQIVSFEPADELGNVSLRGSTSPEVEPPQSWFSFENADLALSQPFALKAGESKQIVLKIKIPAGTREDDYYFTLLFSTEPRARIGGSASQQAGIIGINVLLTVSQDGQPVKKGEILEFSLQRRLLCKSVFCLPIIDSFDKPKFLLRVKNTGRTFWKPLGVNPRDEPFGKLKIEGLLGQEWEQELQPDNVLANSIRQIQVATQSASPSFLIGPYRAKVEFGLEETGQGQSRQGQTLSKMTSFLALPIKAGFGLLTGLVIIFMIKSRLKKKST